MAVHLVPDDGDWCPWCDWDYRGLCYLAGAGGCTVLLVAGLLARRVRTVFVIALLVMCTLFAALSSAVFGFWGLPAAYPLYCYMGVTFYLYFARLLFKPAPPGLLVRCVICIPAVMAYTASMFGLWILPCLNWVPPIIHNGLLLLLAVIGVVQTSVCTRPGETVHVDLSGTGYGSKPRRVTTDTTPPGRNAFTIFQLTDIHVGSFMSPERLAGICRRALARKPDLVLLTGDYLTWETGDAENIARGLAPLRDAMPGRVFAGIGNHDYEDYTGIVDVFKRIGVPLLADLPGLSESAVATLPCGRQVQVIGSRFVFRGEGGPAEQLEQLLDRNPRPQGVCSSVLLLHNPSHFVHLPESNRVDLCLSGHYHGGQVGLLSLGCNLTILGLFSKMCGVFMPDHGLWGHKTDLCYAHRGTGLYGFPLRVGVPSEESVLVVHLSPGC
eukprot:TRINITY_DN3588_c0_g1_i1.p1 TRINITY_DN3588_c0_g1~~TRINITY_DN3588_c0_g1_i1.p1  ORF type:complete len:440 (+),score=79.08 TRINITY_DN3588_c0_g1_i1:75-1394(+)